MTRKKKPMPTRKPSKRKKPKSSRRKQQAAMPVDMPSRGAVEKTLIAHFDVSSYDNRQLAALCRAVGGHLFDKERARRDGHPGVSDVSYTLRTLKYVGDGDERMVDQIKESDYPPSEAVASPPKCPKCGSTDDLTLFETYEAFHAIEYDDELKIPVVTNAWNDTGRMFGDGNADYEARCGCGHRSTDLATFGLHQGEWDWQ